MRAMVLNTPGARLTLSELPRPEPSSDQILIRVLACAVCRTDLHVADGELSHPKLPLILGHEIVGDVAAVGDRVSAFKEGARVGVPWLAGTCGVCPYCRGERENLCDAAHFTGYTVDGGYCEFTLADPRYCFTIPENYSAVSAAPLLCAGLIGYRSLLRAGDAERLGIYGFGTAAHIVAQVALHQGRRVFAFARPGDQETQRFALKQGVFWAGDSTQAPPEPLDAAIIFAPVGELVPLALKNVRKGGVVVCGGIYMSDVPRFPYSLLWEERQLCSVANLTRKDAQEFLKLASQFRIHTTTTALALEQANQALDLLRSGRTQGAVVLIP
ncbi:MAG: zinc-dependent alcohol dehydrogenase family protein [Acidobacteria bacterium]|nr:zinc-dependent alcohol dehydrogenase family protein [Acidobacteriota bacterium]